MFKFLDFYTTLFLEYVVFGTLNCHRFHFISLLITLSRGRANTLTLLSCSLQGLVTKTEIHVLESSPKNQLKK